jgi:predicted small metal-binding protein
VREDRTEGSESEMLVRCACGWEVRGTEDEVVAETQEHGRRLHNMSATREQVLDMAIRRGDTGA